MIPGLGRSAGEGIGYPLQYSWASLVAQLVKNPPAMQETWVRSLGWEDPLEKGKATYSSILAWRIPWTVLGVAKSWTRLSNFHFQEKVVEETGRCSSLQLPAGDPWSSIKFHILLPLENPFIFIISSRIGFLT